MKEVEDKEENKEDEEQDDEYDEDTRNMTLDSGFLIFKFF